MYIAKGAFTRVSQFDQHGWIIQSEPCKHFLSTEVINGVDGWTSWPRPTFVQRRWFTLGNSPQITRINKQVTTCRMSRTSFFPSYFFFLKCVDILSLNIHISQQHLPAQVNLPPFWNRLPRSPSWKCVNSIVQPLNSISLIQPRWSTGGPA